MKQHNAMEIASPLIGLAQSVVAERLYHNELIEWVSPHHLVGQYCPVDQFSGQCPETQ
jgi:hypothetical protein